ncbi:hypothetical protein OUZ56_014244 [Daphnia magna]|uniref:Beta-sarcoglycan n=1 Tax=Daphnia magna TaxID=35525 RepID=A0ABQ9Z892_9CRUS|nr:hypothetical protein OUZ56_014244 [Daphnia magna]
MDCNNGVPSQTSTLSRAEKALVKRNVNRSTLTTAPDTLFFEDSATEDSAKTKKAKNQPRGYAFWALVFALCVVALGNFFLTVTIFSVLRVTKTMENIEVVPSANLIKFFGELEMNKLIKLDGKISGFNESPVTVNSQGSDLNLKVLDDLEPEISISQDKVEFQKVDSFEIFEPRTTPKTNAFSTTFPNFGLPEGVLNLHIKKATANRITSKLEGSLLIRSEKAIRAKGKEGMRIRGREVLFRADQDLLLRSINGSVILNGADGVIMDVDTMSLTGRLEDQNSTKVAEYKLCICMPAGQLFRIPVLEGTDTINCDSIDLTDDDNPCV